MDYPKFHNFHQQSKTLKTSSQPKLGECTLNVQPMFWLLTLQGESLGIEWLHMIYHIHIWIYSFVTSDKQETKNK
jgi:hypothetical protein